MDEQSARSVTFEAIGTHWEVDIYTAMTTGEFENLTWQIYARIDEYDKVYSRFREDSLVTEMSKKAGRYELPEDAVNLFEMYRRLYVATGGKVTPLIGDLLSDAGYDAHYSLTPKASLPSVIDWDDAMSYEPPYLNVKQPALIDVGAAGKGYMIDIVGRLLESRGVDAYLIDAGGDIVHKRADNKPIRIGLGHPARAGEAIGVVSLGNESICGSAGNRRKWAGMHHIMDPDSQESVRDIIATWAIAKSGLEADGLATALFFTPAKELLKSFDFEYVIVYSDMSYESSDSMKIELFTTNTYE